jgi:hypothetical protein
MKALHFRHIIMAFLTLIMTSQAFAQDYSSYNEERPLPKYLRYWHLLNSEPANYPDISEKALMAFKKDYRNANDIQWSIVENKYMARFNNDGRITRILYDNKGHIVYSLSEGTAKNLPADVKKAVRSIYFDYSITMITELHIFDKTAWIVTLEDETSMVTVKVVDDEVIETGNYRKSK